jgi:hypothetical protein
MKKILLFSCLLRLRNVAGLSASSSLVLRVGVPKSAFVILNNLQLSNATTSNSTMSTSSQAPIVSTPGANFYDTDTKNGEEAPANAVSVAPKKKEPPPESPDSIRQRSYVIMSFWAIIIIIGLPIWWKTTAIYRARLPLDQMMDWADGRVHLLASPWQAQS